MSMSIRSGHVVKAAVSATLATVAVLGVSLAAPAPALAAPVAIDHLGSGALAATPLPGGVEQVRGFGRGRGWGFGGPFIAGAIVGGALASPYYGGGDYYGRPYYGGPYYYEGEPPPAYDEGPVNEADDSYCAQRYRSYDPGSGTFLGRDGQRHPCP